MLDPLRIDRCQPVVEMHIDNAKMNEQIYHKILVKMKNVQLSKNPFYNISNLLKEKLNEPVLQLHERNLHPVQKSEKQMNHISSLQVLEKFLSLLPLLPQEFLQNQELFVVNLVHRIFEEPTQKMKSSKEIVIHMLSFFQQTLIKKLIK